MRTGFILITLILFISIRASAQDVYNFHFGNGGAPAAAPSTTAASKRSAAPDLSADDEEDAQADLDEAEAAAARKKSKGRGNAGARSEPSAPRAERLVGDANRRRWSLGTGMQEDPGGTTRGLAIGLDYGGSSFIALQARAIFGDYTPHSSHAVSGDILYATTSSSSSSSSQAPPASVPPTTTPPQPTAPGGGWCGTADSASLSPGTVPGIPQSTAAFSLGLRLSPVHLTLFGQTFLELSALGGAMTTHLEPARPGDAPVSAVALYYGVGALILVSDTVAISGEARIENQEKKLGQAIVGLSFGF